MSGEARWKSKQGSRVVSVEGIVRNVKEGCIEGPLLKVQSLVFTTLHRVKCISYLRYLASFMASDAVPKSAMTLTLRLMEAQSDFAAQAE